MGWIEAGTDTPAFPSGVTSEPSVCVSELSEETSVASGESEGKPAGLSESSEPLTFWSESTSAGKDVSVVGSAVTSETETSVACELVSGGGEVVSGAGPDPASEDGGPWFPLAGGGGV